MLKKFCVLNLYICQTFLQKWEHDFCKRFLNFLLTLKQQYFRKRLIFYIFYTYSSTECDMKANTRNVRRQKTHLFLKAWLHIPFCFQICFLIHNAVLLVSKTWLPVSILTYIIQIYCWQRKKHKWTWKTECFHKCRNVCWIAWQVGVLKSEWFDLC